MKIYLKERKDEKGERLLEYSSDEILKLRGKMEYTSLLSIVSLSEIYYDPDIKNTVITEDKALVEENLLIVGDELEENKENISPWVLRLVLDKDQNFIGISTDELEEIIKKKVKKGGLVVFHSTNSEINEKKFLIRLVCDNTMEEDERERQKSLELLKMFEKHLLTEVSLCGIDSIKKVYVRKVQKIEYDKETGKQLKFPKVKPGEDKITYEPPEESVIETDGTNLAKIFEVDEVDFTRTISNDINEIYQVLGIEAVRNSLLRELRYVLKPYGIYVNYRHISILCDLMTQRGYLTSITRHGLNRGEYGPIRKATFEETVEILLEAGIFSESGRACARHHWL